MEGSPNNDQILTLTEIARYLKVSEKTILRMVQSGQFPGVKVSNQWRFVRDIVDDWLSSRMQSAPKQSLLNVVGTHVQVIPLTRLVSDKRILLGLKSGSKESILEQMVKPLVESGLLNDSPGYVQLLMEREDVVSTAIGRGFAFPHVREPKDSPVSTQCIVLGVCPEGTDFDSLDGGRTHIFAMPCADSEVSHLHLLARISLLFCSSGVLEAIIKSKTKKAVMGILAEADHDLAAQELAAQTSEI